MVSLYWIHAQSSRWKTYVANRVAEIQRLTEAYTWHHINSRHNPADIISRGCHPDVLRDCSPVSYTHLDVYKRQMTAGEFK